MTWLGLYFSLPLYVYLFNFQKINKNSQWANCGILSSYNALSRKELNSPEFV